MKGPAGRAASGPGNGRGEVAGACVAELLGQGAVGVSTIALSARRGGEHYRVGEWLYALNMEYLTPREPRGSDLGYRE